MSHSGVDPPRKMPLHTQDVNERTSKMRHRCFPDDHAALSVTQVRHQLAPVHDEPQRAGASPPTCHCAQQVIDLEYRHDELDFGPRCPGGGTCASSGGPSA